MNKVALITGGSRGIGRAITNKLAKNGYIVVFTYNKSEKQATALCRKLNEEGCNCQTYQLDAGKSEQVDRVFEMIKSAYGGIDILVNNAGIANEKDFLSITADDWDEILKINLRGPFLMTQHCINHMIDKQWGRIINISSIGGQWGGKRQVHYAASKAGLINLTHSLANLYSKEGITANSIAVGLVKTEMTKLELQSLDGIKKINDIPVGRLGSAEEIAGIVNFLCKEEAGYLTGQTINYNGGMLYS